MTIYSNRYQLVGGSEPVPETSSDLYFDKNLERNVRIRWGWLTPVQSHGYEKLLRILSMQSTHIVDVYDVVKKAEGDFGIVYEDCSGPLLDRQILKERTSQDQLKILYQVSRAIADLHSQNLYTPGFDLSFFRFRDSGLLKLWRIEPSICGPTTPEHDSWYLANLCNEFSGISPEIRAQAARLPPIECAKYLASQLLKDTHRALIGYAGTIAELSASRRGVNLSHPAGIAQLSISYDGLRFFVKTLSGEVFINNRAASAGMDLPDACVIALGGSTRIPSQRQFITFDISHPSVVL